MNNGVMNDILKELRRIADALDFIAEKGVVISIEENSTEN